jgi:hypothetical protein
VNAYTEIEARQKYCPASMSRPNGATSCLGQSCMAWRWVTQPAEYIWSAFQPAEEEPTPPAGGGWGMIDSDDSDPRGVTYHWKRTLEQRGLCGLGGNR